MTVLVTGATGYVGSRLVPRLLQDGHEVRVATSDASKTLPWWSDSVQVVEMDALDGQAVADAVRGVDAVYYLIHGMGGEDFAEQDHRAAQHMADAVDRHEVPRLVYLSGIVPDVPSEELSEHISSRLDVEATLAGSTATVIALRAAVLIGSGSTSFEIVRQVAERMPVQTVPDWMDSRVQPIAVVDALEALVGALTVDTGSRHYDLGGPQALEYADLLDLYARTAGLTRTQVGVPLLPDTIVQGLAGRMVDVPTPVVQALIESLHHDMVCADDDAHALLPRGYRLLPLPEAIERSLAEAPSDPAAADPMGPLPQDPDWAEGGEEQSLGTRIAGLVSRVLPDRRGAGETGGAS